MDEYIAREAVRNALYDADAITMEGVRILNQFPAADVKPVVRGEWIDTEPDIPNYSSRKNGMAYYCSACGHRAGKYKHETYAFCPWCGADMRPEEEPAPGPYDLLHEEGGWNLQ